ncbi:hypothetical protein ABSA28_00215 [Candidatus Hepatincolaceae symbiont of Richtersius coronifer]
MLKSKNLVQNDLIKNLNYNKLGFKINLPAEYRRVAFLPDSKGGWYKLSNHYINNSGIINIPYALDTALLTPLIFTIPHSNQTFSIPFLDVVEEVMEDITIQLASIGIQIEFNLGVYSNNNSLLYFRGNQPIILMETVTIGDGGASESVISVSGDLDDTFSEIYNVYRDRFANPVREAAYREILRTMIYHEVGHTLGIDHPDYQDHSGSLLIVYSNENINHGSPIMANSIDIIYDYMFPNLIQRSTIRFAPQELEAFSRANSNNPPALPSMCLIFNPRELESFSGANSNNPTVFPSISLLSKASSGCQPLYIVDARDPSLIFGSTNAFSALNVTDNITDHLNEHFWGHSIKSNNSGFIMASSNLNKLVEAISSTNFTNQLPIYIYEVFPALPFKVSAYYDLYSDGGAMKNSFKEMLDYELYLIRWHVKSDEVYKGRKYIYKNRKYEFQSSVINEGFLPKAQDIITYVDGPNEYNNWRYRTIYKINNNIPYGLSPNAHLGGQGAGSASLNPNLVNIGAYGPYRGNLTYGGLAIGSVTCNFTYNDNVIGKFYSTMFPFAGGGNGTINEDIYFNYPLSNIVGRKIKGVSINFSGGSVIAGVGTLTMLNTDVINGGIHFNGYGLGFGISFGADGYFYNS